MKKYLSILALLLAIPCLSFAQSEDEAEVFQGVDGIVKKEHIANKKFIPYVHVREADVLWSKTIWRVIDLREKINLPLYYPTKNVDGRKSLINVIMDAIQAGELTPYSTSTEDEFTKRIEYDELAKMLGVSTDTFQTVNPETGLIETTITTSEMSSDLVKQYMIKEVWYFDKKYTRMDVRIIGISPIMEQSSEDGSRVDKKQLCWVYFPELRPFLAQNEVFNTKNDSQRESFDDVFAKRRFGSYIFREANVYNNRNIIDYTAGMESNLEAERIKNEIFVKEHDMWEF